MLQEPNVARAGAHDPRDRLDVEIADDAEEHDVGLFRREGGRDQIEGRSRADG
jgi:hypothetical protein